MGVYSLNRTNLSYYDESEIIADESYDGVAGCYQAMIDMETNSHTLFEEAITRDFLEATYIHEGKDEELMSLQEASISNIFERIKSFMKKVWEKIKGIFNNFLRKLDTVIMRDNKEFAKKYKAQVMGKDLSKMKYKWCDPTGNLSTLKDKVSGSEIKGEAESVITNVSNENNADDFKKIKAMIEDGDYYDHIVNKAIPAVKTDYKSMEKDIHDWCFESSTNEEGLSKDRVNSLYKILISDDVKKDVKKTQETTNKYFANILSDLDKASTAASKIDLKGDASDDDPLEDDIKYKNYAGSGADADTSGKKHNVEKLSMSKKHAVNNFVSDAGVASEAIQKIEAVHNKLVACFLRENKFYITQARRVFAKAVSYSPKKAKNEAAELYYDAIEEAAQYEMDILFESYE